MAMPRFRRIGFVFREILSIVSWRDNRTNTMIQGVVAPDTVVGLLIVGDKVLLVPQNRPTMDRQDNQDGQIFELPEGKIEELQKEGGPKTLLIQLAHQLTGVKLAEEDIEIVNVGMPMALSPGVSTHRCVGHVAFLNPANWEPTPGSVWMSVEDFISHSTVHDDVRVWGFAQWLARRLVEQRLAELLETVNTSKVGTIYIAPTIEDLPPPCS